MAQPPTPIILLLTLRTRPVGSSPRARPQRTSDQQRAPIEYVCVYTPEICGQTRCASQRDCCVGCRNCLGEESRVWSGARPNTRSYEQYLIIEGVLIKIIVRSPVDVWVENWDCTGAMFS